MTICTPPCPNAPKMVAAMPVKEKPLDLTKPVQTRDGLKARIICTDAQRRHAVPARPVDVIALVMEADGEIVRYYDLKGQNTFSNCYDLINIPEKTSTYQRVYRAESGWGGGAGPWTNSYTAKLENQIGMIRRNYIDGVYSDCEFIPADKLATYEPE